MGHLELPLHLRKPGLPPFQPGKFFLRPFPVGQDLLQGGAVLALQALQEAKALLQLGQALRVPFQVLQVGRKLGRHRPRPLQSRLQVLGQGLEGPVVAGPGPELAEGGFQSLQSPFLHEGLGPGRPLFEGLQVAKPPGLLQKGLVLAGLDPGPLDLRKLEAEEVFPGPPLPQSGLQGLLFREEGLVVGVGLGVAGEEGGVQEGIQNLPLPPGGEEGQGGVLGMEGEALLGLLLQLL